MLKLITIIILATFLGCTNTADTHHEITVADTIEIGSGYDIYTTKPNSIPAAKPIKKDTIRNQELTKMSEDFFQKAIIYLGDSSLVVYQNIRADYRIFGYEQPDTNSRKMVFFSVFTPDVKGNPYKCPYGSYYYSGAMENTQIKYVKNLGNFVEANLVKHKTELLSPIYILKEWVDFEEEKK